MRARFIMFLLISLAVRGPAQAAPSGDARDLTEDVGTVRGPLSDFWFKVRSEWAGYLRADREPAPGGGPLPGVTRSTPAPNRVWVSLVHGDLDSGTWDTALAHLYDEFISEWKVAEGRNWPYAHIYARPWEKMGANGREQNIIMIGTPWALPPVGPLAESLGILVEPGRIQIGNRRYAGRSLILVFIAPNPMNREKYALVITGSNDEALLQASHIPYGETDYVLFHGRRLLESGHFKKETAAWAEPEIYEAQGSHHGFAIRESKHYTFWYERDRIPRESLDALAGRKDAMFEQLLAKVPPFEGDPPRLTYFLYPTVDRKIDETSRDDVVHVDLAAGAVHAVYSPTQDMTEPYLDLMVLLHTAIGPTSVPRLERAVAIALAPEFQGREVGRLAAPIFEEARRLESAPLRALRDHNVMTPADGPPSPHDLLLAGFVQDLIHRHGPDPIFSLLSEASAKHLDKAFKRAYGLRLGDALDEWTAGLRPEAEPESRVAARQGPSIADGTTEQALEMIRLRRDDEALELLEQALVLDPHHPTALAAVGRARFRRGDFDGAERAARSALEVCAAAEKPDPACEESRAWSRLTLGRIEALRGRQVAAHVELTHPAVQGGPEPVPTLADYWLFTMGQSRNQLTVVSHLKRQARVALRNLDWRSAEEDLKSALKIDPTDGDAHKLLGEVYHKHHEYWAWQIRYLNEIHPDYNVLNQVYIPQLTPLALRVESLHTLDSFNDLVLKGNLELLKAQSLYAVEIQNLHAEGDRFLIVNQDPDRALDVYLKSLELNSDFFLSHFLVGRCLFLMERREEAREAFNEVLERNPRDPLVLAWTHTYLGYLSLEEEDLLNAQRSFRRALAQTSEGKAAALAREGLGKVSTIRLLQPSSNGRP